MIPFPAQRVIELRDMFHVPFDKARHIGLWPASYNGFLRDVADGMPVKKAANKWANMPKAER